MSKSKRQAHHSKTNFSFEAMKEKLDTVLTERVPEFPKQVQLQLPKLNLPKLNKVQSPKQPKLKLPKLKKIEQ